LRLLRHLLHTLLQFYVQYTWIGTLGDCSNHRILFVSTGSDLSHLQNLWLRMEIQKVLILPYPLTHRLSRHEPVWKCSMDYISPCLLPLGFACFQ
jgi:hypothetical protein